MPGNMQADDITESINGTGNLIVGYNESREADHKFDCHDGWSRICDRRGGSHNVVVGRQHNYSMYGGLVLGYYNEIEGAYASVTGGTSNYAHGHGSSISGGIVNNAYGDRPTISGGYDKTATNENCIVGDNGVDC